MNTFSKHSFRGVVPKLCLIVILAIISSPVAVRAQSDDEPVEIELLPRDFEIELARSAAPEHLRENISIHVLTETGYEQVSSGSNALNCFVSRAGVMQGRYVTGIAPICFDEEGSRTLWPAEVDQARMLSEGWSLNRVYEVMKQRFADGTYETPNGGIVYMMSAANMIPVLGSRPYARPYVPHLMFLSPYATPEHIGQPARFNPLEGMPFIPVPGEPWSSIVVPLESTMRDRIMQSQADLRERAKNYVLLQDTQESPTRAEKEAVYAFFEDMVGGQWEINAAWADGTPFRQRQEFTSGPGKAFFLVHTTTPDENGEWITHSEGVRGWATEENRGQFWEFTRHGDVTSGSIHMAGDDLIYEYEYPMGDQVMVLREMLSPQSPNRMQYKVGTWEAGKWTSLFLDAVITRK